jgi:hypothetical protein
MVTKVPVVRRNQPEEVVTDYVEKEMMMLDQILMDDGPSESPL